MDEKEFAVMTSSWNLKLQNSPHKWSRNYEIYITFNDNHIYVLIRIFNFE